VAVASIAVPPDPARDARAAALVDQVPTWPKHTLKVAWGSFEAGTTFRRAIGSRGERYLVNAVACQCPDYQSAGQICKHVRAVVLFEQRQAQPAPAPKRKSYSDLFLACPCGDVAESKDGLCDRCAAEQTYRLDAATRRELVASR
jgi:hypothetical protein